MKIKAAIFDMDGTLVDSLFYWNVFWKELGEKYLGTEDYTPDPETDKTIRTMILSDAMLYIKEKCAIDVSDEEIIAFSNSSLEEFYRTRVKPKAGVESFLKHLKQSGVRMCVASASEKRYVETALDACGLSEYFDLLLSCADIGKGKDCPDIYLKALEELGTDCGNTCVFEDSCVALETARKAGFRTVGVFDRYNYGQDRLEKASDIYLCEGMTMDSLTREF